MSTGTTGGNAVSPTSQEFQLWSDDLLRLHNNVRGNSKLGLFSLSGRLCKAAMKHAAWMATEAKLDHTGKGGSSAGKRVTDEQFVWCSVRENIAWNQQSPYDVMIGWLKSPGHKANIFATDVNTIGFGFYYRVNGTKRDIYWCTVFAKPMK